MISKVNMAFNWRAYLRLAEDLCKQNTEVHYRAAVSRAYYAIFNILKIKAGYRKADGSFHQDFISLLKIADDNIVDKLNISADNLRDIGIDLDTLRKERNFADYDGLQRFDEERASQNIEKVKAIFQIYEEANS